MRLRNRNRGKIFVFSAMLFVLLGSGIPLWSEAVLSELQGKVEVMLPGRAWSSAERGMVLPLKTMISTGFNSSASLDLGTSVIHLEEFTRMFIEELVQREDVITTDLQLNVGKIRAEVESSEGLTHDFNVLSTVSVASVRGTDFEYDGESLYCIKGEVLYFNLLRQKRTVRTGEEVRLAVDEPPLSPEETLLADTNVQARPAPASPDLPGDEPEPVLPVPEVIGAYSDSNVTVSIGWPE
jgi:hypothetical protein